MINDKGSISSSSYLFGTACIIQASSTLTGYVSSVTTKDTWAAVLLGIIFCLPIMALYGTLMSSFPGKNLLEMAEILFGKALGKAVSLGYTVFFILLTGLNLGVASSFVRMAALRNTPTIVVVIAFTLVCAYAVCRGITVVTRCSFIFSMLSWLGVGIAIIAMLSSIDINNFLPALEAEPFKYLQGAHIIATIPFGEVVIVAMLNSNIDASQMNIRRMTIAGFLVGAMNILFVVLRDIGVLGNTLPIFVYPSFETMRLLNLSQGMSRIETIFTITYLILMLYKISLLLYVSVQAVATLLNLPSGRPALLSVAAAVVTLSLNAMPSPNDRIKYATTIVPFLWVIFEFLFPAAMLFLAVARRFIPLRRARGSEAV